MAEEVNKDAAATFYNVRTMNKWFLASAAVMTLAYCWSVVDDHDREWKGYQRQFEELERQTSVRQGQKALKDAGGEAAVENLHAEVERLQAVIAADTEQRPELVKELKQKEFEFNVATAEMKTAKANYEADRFKYEELAHTAHEADLYDPRDQNVRTVFVEFDGKKNEYVRKDEIAKAAEAARDEAKAVLDRNDALVRDVAKKLEEREREVIRLEKRADSVDTELKFNKFRNSIFFSFMSPTVAAKKIVVNEIFDDLNFLTIPKVDMCITCHLATDRNKDYEAGDATKTYDPKAEPDALPPVFRSHSMPELFCTSLSPHNQERFGCSGCHQGANQRMTFWQSFHTPTDEAEMEVWEHDPDLKWKHVHEWDYPMLSSPFFEASCYKCHKNESHIPGAAKWNRGRDLVEKLGCYGCHKMAPFDGHRKVGPPLAHVVSKFADLDFMLKWVDGPQNFRPTTRMPAFFHRPNRKMEPGRDQAEITALVTYLYSLATPIELKKYPGNGDAARGKEFIGDMGGVGCLACHNIDDYKNNKVGDIRHGPDLSGIGSKVTADWLYTWILDPKSLWPDTPLFPGTNMPNLRLTEAQAADVVAYLMTKKNVAFEQQQFVKPADDAIYEQILTEKMTERMTTARAQDEIKLMTGIEKRRKAGEYLLNHYGCFGCHEIPGYEDAKPIGTELNGWGSKHADRLDFGEVEMGWKKKGWFNRETWLKQKLSNTRFYDAGKDKKPFEKLKMPQFSLLAGPDLEQPGEEEVHASTERAPSDHLADVNAAEREAVMTFILSLMKDNTAPSILRQLTPSEQAVERGRRLVREKNCFGCHMIYGEGGEIRKFSDAAAEAKKAAGDENAMGSAYYPPILDGQGARTQPDWLFKFLGDPSMGAGRGAKDHMRPWLKAKMPTFGFSQEQLNDLVTFFANEEVWHTSIDRQKWDDVVEKFRKDFPAYDQRSMLTADATKQQLFQILVARQYRKLGGRFLHDTDFPYLQPTAGLSDRDAATARALFESSRLNCIQCHAPGGIIPANKTEADLAPDLRLARTRLAPTWVKHWFEGPKFYQPGTRMPPFWPLEDGKRASQDPDGLNDANKEMELLRDYIFSSQFPTDYPQIAEKAFGPQKK